MHRRQFTRLATASPFVLAGLRGKSLAEGSLGRGQDGKQLKAAVIGTGWFGMVNTRRMLEVDIGIRVSAICDVDKSQLKGALNQIASFTQHVPKQFTDYRKMLAEEKYDIVIVGTPDHWHPLCMIAAVEAGADVYVEKPISKDIAEGKAMVAAARKHNRIVQVGTQRRSTPHIRQAMEIVRSGTLGQIVRVHTCCFYHMRDQRTEAQAPNENAPSTLDFQMWTGPADYRPFNKTLHPRSWRAYNEYSNGIMGDMCVHWLDTARMILDLGQPLSVSSTGGILVQKKARSNIADTQSALFDYGSTKVTWEHRTWGNADDDKYPWALTLIGDKGTMKINLDGFEVWTSGSNKGKYTEAKKISSDTDSYRDTFDTDLFNKTKKYDDSVAPGNQAHWRNFLMCVISREKPVADIEQGHASTLACILANMSMKLGRSLKWDAAKGEIVGDAEANSMLAMPYRAPWKHPGA